MVRKGEYLSAGKGITYFYMFRERAESLKPILKLVKDASPDPRDRILAADVLKEIEGIKDHKQVGFNKKEMQLVKSIDDAFPGGATPEGHQYVMFDSKPLEARPVSKSSVSGGPQTRPVDSFTYKVGGNAGNEHV